MGEQDAKILTEELKLQSEMITNMSEGVNLIKATDRSIVYCNPKFEQMFGYNTGELIGKHFSVVNAPSDLLTEETEKKIIESLDKYNFWQGEVKNITKTGKHFWCFATVFTFNHQTYGKVWVSVHTDITQRKKAQEDLSRFFNLSVCMLCIADINGYFKALSSSWEKTLGYTEEELKSKPFIEFVHPDDVEKTLKEVAKLSQGVPTIYFENRYLCKDGTYKLLAWTSAPVPEEHLTYATAYDITRIEETIKSERDKLKGILDIMEDGIYIVTKDYDIDFINKALIKGFGEVHGRKCYEYFHDRTESCPWCKNEEVFSGKSVTWQWYSPKNNKTYSLFDAPMRNVDGSIYKFEIFHDISEIKQAKMILQRELDFQTAVAEVSEALLSPERDIVDISVIINKQARSLTKSLHGHVSEIDKNTQEQVGHTHTEMMDKGLCNVDTRYRRLAFPKGKDGYNALWGHSLNTKQGFYTNTPEKHPAYKGCIPEGHIPIVRYMSVPALLGNKLIGNIALANSERDYTDEDLNIIKRLASIYALAVERKRIEEELRNINTHLEAMVKIETEKRRAHEQMLIQQSKMASMGEMIGLIAHQWKQPLNSVGLSIQDLKDAYAYGEVDDEFIDNLVGSTKQQIDFMAKTIDDFRNFFIPSKKKVFFDVKTAIEELLSMFIHIFSKSDIDISVKAVQNTALLTWGYPNEFKQVVLNILNNSRDAIISKKKINSEMQGSILINISNSEDNSKIVISMKDNGGGVPEDVITKIFEPYFTTKEKEGTGIGLYMSKTIIETNMGGGLTVGNVNGGAEFLINLDVYKTETI
ncbi:MAG: PAS domain S-box protein [Nitrospirae bacterium YQR-1]